MSEKEAFINRRQKEEEDKRIRVKLEKAYEEEKAKVNLVEFQPFSLLFSRNVTEFITIS